MFYLCGDHKAVHIFLIRSVNVDVIILFILLSRAQHSKSMIL